MVSNDILSDKCIDNFKNRYVSLLKSNNLTPSSLSTKIGISKSELVKYKTPSNRSYPSTSQYQRFCTYFNLGIHEFMKLPDDSARDEMIRYYIYTGGYSIKNWHYNINIHKGEAYKIMDGDVDTIKKHIKELKDLFNLTDTEVELLLDDFTVADRSAAYVQNQTSTTIQLDPLSVRYMLASSSITKKEIYEKTQISQYRLKQMVLTGKTSQFELAELALVLGKDKDEFFNCKVTEEEVIEAEHTKQYHLLVSQASDMRDKRDEFTEERKKNPSKTEVQKKVSASSNSTNIIESTSKKNSAKDSTVNISDSTVSIAILNCILGTFESFDITKQVMVLKAISAITHTELLYPETNDDYINGPYGMVLREYDLIHMYTLQDNNNRTTIQDFIISM